MTGETLQHYAVLGIPADASLEQITARYKAALVEARSKIASQQLDAQELARLREAYSVLSDSERRARYDRGCAARPSIPQKHELRLVDMDVGEVAA